MEQIKKKERKKQTSETVCTDHQILNKIQERVPDCLTSNGKKAWCKYGGAWLFRQR